MFCTNCGKKVSADSKFCPKCGGRVSEEKLSISKDEGKPRRRRTLKVLGIFVAILAVLIIVPAVSYIFTVSGAVTYEHPSIGFTINHPKSLQVETRTSQSGVPCKASAPCFVVFKNSYYNDYIVNWFVTLSATDAGIDKETFLAGLTDGLKEDLDNGLATTMTVGDKTIYKYENDSSDPTGTVTGFSNMVGLDPSLEKTMYVFDSGDSAVIISFRKPPTGAPSGYKDYLYISSLVIP